MTDSNDPSQVRDGLFISYRRGETSGQARALYEHLAERFGEQRVFMDVDSIAPGTDFVQRIEEAIGSSCVVLALIGRDWTERNGESRLLDNPEDFIRLELDKALQSHVPTIPVLVERARMPEPDQLPEELRPLARINALELENGRWDFDVSRLVTAVERHVNVSATAAGPAVPAKVPRPEVAQVQARRRPSRRTLLSVAVAVVVVAAVVAVVLTRPKPAHHVAPKLSAAGAVAKVAPDRLVNALLKTPLPSADIPSGSTARKPYLGAFRDTGLDAVVVNSIAGPATDIFAEYEVFDNQGDASSFFASDDSIPGGYTGAGTFSASGVRDKTTCERGHGSASPTPWVSGCQTLSNKVILFNIVYSDAKDFAANDAYVETLTRDAVRHLDSTASSSTKAAYAAPPGGLSAQALYEQILTTQFDPALLPFDLSDPHASPVSLGSSEPPGLTFDDRIDLSFSGPDASDYINFYVFNTAALAASWYSTGLRPSGSKSTGTLDSWGSTAETNCGTYTQAATATGKAIGISACYVLDGDVIAEARTEDTDDATAGDGILAVTLARMAVLDLESITSP